MQQLDVYYQLLSQHVSGIIMPIFRRKKTVSYCIWCTVLILLAVVGSGCEALRCRVWALWRLKFDFIGLAETEVDNKYLIVASCWFSLFWHFAHDARSQEHKDFHEVLKTIVKELFKFVTYGRKALLLWTACSRQCLPAAWSSSEPVSLFMTGSAHWPEFDITFTSVSDFIFLS